MSDKPAAAPVKKPSFMCIACSGSEDEVAFWTAKDLFVHEKSGHTTKGVFVELPPAVPVTLSATEQSAQGIVSVTATEQQLPEMVKVEPKLLELTYRWLGVHKLCNTEPKTIVVELGDKWIITAYCLNCDQTIAQQEVAALPKKKEEKPNNSFEENVKPKK